MTKNKNMICFNILYIFFSFLFSKVSSIQLLKKYSSIKVSCSDLMIAFDSSEFNLNDDLYFTFKLDSKNLEKTLLYDFYENIDVQDDNLISILNPSKKKEPDSSLDTKTNNIVTERKNYYTIKKEIEYDFLLLDFQCSGGSLTIENTKKSGDKVNTIIIIVIACVFGVILIVVMIVVCIKRRANRMARAALRMSASGYYPQPGMAMSMGMSVVPPVGGSYMMGNIPPHQGNLAMQQPVAYSRMGNDVTQVTPNQMIPPPSSGRKIGVKKFK